MDISTGTTIASVASTTGVVLVAYLAYKTAELNKKVDIVKEQTNGILISKDKNKTFAEGKAAAALEIAVAVITKPTAPAASGSPAPPVPPLP